MRFPPKKNNPICGHLLVVMDLELGDDEKSCKPVYGASETSAIRARAVRIGSNILSFRLRDLRSGLCWSSWTLNWGMMKNSARPVYGASETSAIRARTVRIGSNIL